ncbi:TPA: energy transducer TonB [Morganella morganii subsp. morganii]|uniref:Energy transducer TonB n=1 Tax=Morganella morganii TaxID=582 RepID=A0AAU8ZJ86_MORMO|nr:energy transducer TonB [Morganella morganii]HDU8693982.1 energy transducer TonB [Morganella morganii subsp. morganii]AWC93225.1 energy transducer TonB [Morganella morganii]EKW8487153.1 energy transducer TonB [Morganella morganii]EKW8488613.1 energy transducer TonB [Morganella morganii]HAT3626085.1 energy transducer TonB [Morganella morganii]
MYGAIALPHPSFLFSRERTGTWQQMVSAAVIGVCFSVAGLLITGSPRVTTPQQHQIDNRGQTPAASVVIQMNAAPAYQETEPEAEQLPPPQESPSQAELATARRTTQEKTTKPPSKKPAVKAVNKKAEKSEPVTTESTADTGENKTTQQQSGGQAVSPTNSATAGADNRKTQEDYFNLLRQKIEEQKHYPRRARSAGQRGISTISFSLDDSGKPFAPVVTRSSGYELLDNAAMDAVIRVAAVGTPPPGAKRRVTFSLRFQLNKGF